MQTRYPLLKMQAVSPNRRARLGHTILVLVVLTMLIVGLYLSPSPKGLGTHRQLGLPPCTFYLMTGKPCPSCGMTTSVSATLKGNFAQALTANPFGIFFLLLALGTAANSLSILLKGKSFRFHPALAIWGVPGFVILWFLFGIARFFLAEPVPFSERY